LNSIKKNNWNIYLIILGILLIPAIWVIVKYLFNIEDRFLPSPQSLVDAFTSIEPNIIIHFLYSFSRLLIGFSFGIFAGILFGLFLYKSKFFYNLLNPAFQSLRSIPPFATIPFFLLWFGFSETGKFIIIVFGISFNLAIASYQTLSNIDDKYHIYFRSINKEARNYIRAFTLPYICGNILPTLRFSLSTAIGLVVVAEMLGSQIGLGYLINTSKSTFSLNVVFLAAILFGIINFLTDKILIFLWKKIVYWQK
jgi:ABC-type nitrate/sulfonate/bicarbonate transport system permease component